MLRIKGVNYSSWAPGLLPQPAHVPCKHHLPNHHKRYHDFHFACGKLKPQRQQVICPRSHSWEAAEPGQAFWASATLERMLVGKPFSTERVSTVQKPQEAFQGSQVGCKSGRARGQPGALTAGQPEAVCQDQVWSGAWGWLAAWREELWGDAPSSWMASVGAAGTQ